MKATDTLLWILYDIGNNKARNRVAKHCLEAGLYRVQLSVFLGTLPRNRLDELALLIEDEIDTTVDKVYLFPLCGPDFRKVKVLGQGFDPKRVTDEVLALLL